MKRYLILAVLLAATSCSTTRYVSSEPSLKAEWVGRSHADIVRNFGAPTREVSDGADGVILVYESFYTTHETDHLGSTITTTSEEHRNYKEFSIGTDEICYEVRTNEKMADGKVFDKGGTILASIFGGVCSFIVIMWIVVAASS
ncbi:MAG: hypothetical protein II435_06835 [Bacteroidales bacterium]|nr:hypothetical protein [Bacteroidales bacterium]MBQ1755013.1 hypothetical protein [Bacteroidales bacterium]MBQ2149649.1 hypothetical protein [Bacteroidales bacterium]